MRTRLVPTKILAWALGIGGVVALALTHKVGGAPEGWARVSFWGFLGDASYSIYLPHLLTLSLIAGFLVPLWVPVAVVLAVLCCAHA